MVRRSSLIIAASLAVLSTFEPGALCFAAAAPAEPPMEDRFERPRFLKKEIKRYVFANTTMTTQSQPPNEHTSTSSELTSDALPVTSLTPQQIASSLSAASLASVEASFSSASPGVPFPASLVDLTSNPLPPTTTPPAANPTTQGNTPASESAAQSQPTGTSKGNGGNGGNEPGSTPSSSAGAPVVFPVLGGPSTTPPVVPGQTTNPPVAGQSNLVIPVNSDSSHTPGGVPISLPVNSDTSQTPGGGLISLPVNSDSSHTPGGVQQTTEQAPTNGQSQVTNGGNGATNTPAQGGTLYGQQTDSTGGIIGGITSKVGGIVSTPPVLAGPSNAAPSPNPATTAGAQPASTGEGQPVQTAVPATANSGAVTPGSTPTGAPVVVASNPGQSLPPGPNTNSFDAALSSALAVTPPSVVNSLGQTVPNPALTGNPIVPGAPTSAPIISPPASETEGRFAPGSAPAESGSAPPVAPGSLSNGLGQGVPTTGSPATGSIPAASGSATGAPGAAGPSTDAHGNPVSNTASPPSGTGAPPAAELSNTAVPVASGSGTGAPGAAGPSTDASGNAVSNTASPPSGTGAPPAAGVATNANNNGESNTAPAASGPQQTGIVPANAVVSPAASNVAGSIPPQSTPGAVGPTSAQAPLPIATAPQSYNTNLNTPISQQPIASDSMTSQLVGTSIVVAPSPSPTVTSEFAMTGLPSGIPLVLYPPTGPVNRPDNTELIQIGFLYPLNYPFVWQHEESQRQIFKYLPTGISYGLQIDPRNVTMQTLRAWDTTKDLHYITTLALAWVPAQLVDSLGLILHTQAERFYHNPDPAVRTLLSMINPALPIRADNSTDGGTGTVGASPTGSGSANGQGTIADGINNSSPVKASSVGIGIGVFCGAAAYGAAMFFVARRYKKRRQSHLRSPSMYSSPVMSHNGADPAAAAALMSGGMGERSVSPYYDNDRGPSRGSGRSGSSAGRQQISAPVMAENSLGWN